VRDLAAGEILFKQGDLAAAIYKVESGRLRLVRRTVDDHLVVLLPPARVNFLRRLLFSRKLTTAMPSLPGQPELGVIRRQPS
jgi:CRP-like cAMP-binding protein